ncbi:hypothetical protein HGRIS_008827 [Hohenbuehelia grisea]|uniref:Uncharacterized protein n=1 Tax=Hohenbuehelia grisea TaxID=104357 RepID=A0ABR3IZE5_9AGAR
MNGARLEISNQQILGAFQLTPCTRLRNAIGGYLGFANADSSFMTAAPEYSIAIQAMIPCALAALHNFITIHDPDNFADEGLLDGQRATRHILDITGSGGDGDLFSSRELGDASAEENTSRSIS